jgi:hypothetical protein
MLEDLHDLRQDLIKSAPTTTSATASTINGYTSASARRERKLLALLEVIGELSEHARQLADVSPAATSVGRDRKRHAERAERLCDRVAREHSRRAMPQHLVERVPLGLLDQRVEGLLDRESRLEERGEPERELRGSVVESAHGAEPRPPRGIVRRDDLDAIGREPLVAQLRARLPRAVRLEDALVELPSTL